MRKLILAIVASLIGGAELSFAQAPPASPGYQALASEHCVPKVIQRTPGRFIAKPAAQVVEVDRLVKTSPEGPVCIFEIGVADAFNPYESRHQVYLWEVPGPGQVFTNGYWHVPELEFQVLVDVVHLQGLAVDQVLATHVIKKNGFPFTHIRLFAFNPANGYQVELLNIGARGEITASVKDGDLSVRPVLPERECSGCDNRGELVLGFDHDSNSLAIRSPVPSTIALYKYLQNTVRLFSQ